MTYTQNRYTEQKTSNSELYFFLTKTNSTISFITYLEVVRLEHVSPMHSLDDGSTDSFISFWRNI